MKHDSTEPSREMNNARSVGARTKSGETIKVAISLSHLREDGETKGVAVLRDREEIESLNAALLERQQIKMIEESSWRSLLRQIDSEISTQCRAINQLVSLLESSDSEVAKTQSAIGIRRASDMLMSMKIPWSVDNPSNNHRPSIEEVTVNLKEYITGQTEDWRRLLAASSNSLVDKSKLDGVVVEVDRRVLSSAVRAVLHNVNEHCPHGTRVRLRTRLEKREVFLDFSDDGPGVKKRALKRLGYPQVEQLSQTGSHGEEAGLNLFTSKQLLTRTGGNMSFDNADPTGLTVTIQLKLSDRGKAVNVA